MSLENPNFLKKKYDLHQSPEVESAAERTEKRTDEKVSQKPEMRIQNYLERFKEINDRTDPDKRERGLRALKHVLHEKFVIKSGEIPEAYFENQRRIAREQGHGDIEITDDMRQQLSEVIITDQETTLDNWVDYLASDDAIYPDWLKYYAFRSVIGLSTFDKEKHEFGKRGKSTTAPFPDLNREALAYVLDAVEKKFENKVPQLASLEPEEQKRFLKLLQDENFGKLYAFAVEKVTPAQVEQLAITEGEWIKYEQNSDHIPLVESLQGHGTGWCTAGESTAQAQLSSGDFYVYYSYDQDGKSTIPRVAIRMEGEHIAEVRGIAHEQNLDPYIGEIVEDKLKEFGSEGEAYQKKSADMQKLTAIDNKVKSGKDLSKKDLIFLYEIDQPIEGFGYQKDPRIGELRDDRDFENDISSILEISQVQIAHTESEINENTKVYVGPLYPEIIEKIQSVEYVFTSPEIMENRHKNLEIGTIPKKEIEHELEEAGVRFSIFTRKVMQSKKFTMSEHPEQLNLLAVTVAELGFTTGAIEQEVIQQANKLGLSLCPAEVGPYLRLKERTNVKLNSFMKIAMEPIISSDGEIPATFQILHEQGGQYLEANDYNQYSLQDPDVLFIFLASRRKEENPFSIKYDDLAEEIDQKTFTKRKNVNRPQKRF